MGMEQILCLVLFIAPFSILAHEIGHIACALFLHADSTALSIGRGKQVYYFSGKKIETSIHLVYFTGGASAHTRIRPYRPIERIWIALSGPLLNGFIMLFAYMLFDFNNPFIRLMVLFNCWLFIVNLIPFKWKGQQSDGYIIVKSFTSMLPTI